MSETEEIASLRRVNATLARLVASQSAQLEEFTEALRWSIGATQCGTWFGSERCQDVLAMMRRAGGQVQRIAEEVAPCRE